MPGSQSGSVHIIQNGGASQDKLPKLHALAFTELAAVTA
jgi:hypothetical protein